MGNAAPRSQAGRLAELDIIRGFAVLLVIFYHCAIALPVAGLVAPGWVEVINQTIAPLRMPLLGFLSGMLLPRSLTKPARSYVDGKLRGIGWPYLVWTAITLLVLSAGSALFGEGSYTGWGLVAVLRDPRTYTWYLAYLLIYYLLSLIIPERVRGWLIPVLWVGCALLDDQEGWSRFTSLLACFWSGEWFARRPAAAEFVRQRWVLALGAVLLVTMMGLAVAGLPVRYTIWSLPALLGTFVVALPLARTTSRTPPGRALAAMGRDSIVYYLTHWPLVVVLVNLLAAARPGSAIGVLLVLLVAALLVCALAVWLRPRWAPVALAYNWPARP